MKNKSKQKLLEASNNGAQYLIQLFKNNLKSFTKIAVLSTAIFLISPERSFAKTTFISFDDEAPFAFSSGYYCRIINIHRKETGLRCSAGGDEEIHARFVSQEAIIPDNYKILFLGVRQNKVAIMKKDVDEEVVYNIVKSIFDGYDSLITLFPNRPQDIHKNNMAKVDITKLHPGALRFYQEQKLIK